MRKREEEKEEKKKNKRKEDGGARKRNAESDTESKGRTRGGRLQKAGTGWALSFFQKPVL